MKTIKRIINLLFIRKADRIYNDVNETVKLGDTVYKKNGVSIQLTTPIDAKEPEAEMFCKRLSVEDMHDILVLFIKLSTGNKEINTFTPQI